MRRKEFTDFDLNGRVAIVTGAAQGMGKAIAIALAEKGATVCLSDRDADKVIETARELKCEGHQTLGLAADVTSEEQVAEMVAQTIQSFGGVHILVNNAGILYPTRCHEMSSDEWRLVMNVNLNGPFYCSIAVLKYMKNARFGRIVNMSSSAGRSVSTLGGAHYTASKAGLLGLTRAMAREMAPFGITVNAVCPGLIATEMVYSDCEPDQLKHYAESFPIPRLGTPAEVAAPIAFLCSDAAAYITGASLDINGGDLML